MISMERALLDELRQRLERDRENLRAEIQQIEDQEVHAENQYDPEFSGYGNHMAETGTEIYEQERNLTLEQTLKQQLADVEHALAKFDEPLPGSRYLRWVPLVLAPEWAKDRPDQRPPRPGPELLKELSWKQAHELPAGGWFDERASIHGCIIRATSLRSRRPFEWPDVRSRDTGNAAPRNCWSERWASRHWTIASQARRRADRPHRRQL